MSDLRDYAAPVRVSVARPVLIGQADRDLIIPLYFFALGIVLTSLTEIHIIVPATVIVGMLHWGLTRLAKYDPHWRVIVLRLLRYQKVYPATVHPTVQEQKPPQSVPPMRYLY